MELIRESVIPTGPSTPALAGVVTEPVSEEPRRAGILFLNAGVLHHVGPNRLHVRLARRAARAGWLACRFDLSGRGDSPASEEAGSAEERATREIRSVMDWLQASYGVEAFTLFGICSGADHALHAALEDDRVQGAVLVNGALVPEEHLGTALDDGRTETQWRYYSSRLGWKSLVRFLTFKTDYVRLVRTVGGKLCRTLRRGRDVVGPPEAGPSRPLERLAQRGVALFLIYTEGSPFLHVFRTTLQESFLRICMNTERNRLQILEGVDHVFTPVESQIRLTTLLCEWLPTQRGR